MSAEGILPPARRPSRAGVVIALAFAAFGLMLVSFAAGWMLGARRTVMAALSPSHDAVASVIEARCSDGTCESLRLAADQAGRRARTLEALTGDERVDEIAWTPDGGRVAFLVNGYQLRLFDAHTGANLGAVSLIEPDATPTSRIARGVTFSSNGAAVTFDNCPRDHSGCQPGLVAIANARSQ